MTAGARVLGVVPRVRAHAAVRRVRVSRRVLAAALGVAALVVVVAWAVLLQTSWLAVDRVVVTGADRLSVAQVLAAADVRVGTPLARVDTGGVEQRVAALAPVRRVRAERAWPGTLRLAVTERRVAAAVVTAAGVSLLDADGVAFDREARLPAGTVRLQVHRPGPRDAATRAALDVFATLPAGLRARTAMVHAAAPDTVVLRLRDGRQVVWGDGGRAEEKAVAAQALLRLPGARYDVSSPGVVVRQ